jgi:hypothetical protein
LPAPRNGDEERVAGCRAAGRRRESRRRPPPAIEFTVNVMVFAVVVTVPEPEEAVSQLGVVIEYFTLPNVELSL